MHNRTNRDVLLVLKKKHLSIFVLFVFGCAVLVLFCAVMWRVIGPALSADTYWNTSPPPTRQYFAEFMEDKLVLYDRASPQGSYLCTYFPDLAIEQKVLAAEGGEYLVRPSADWGRSRLAFLCGKGGEFRLVVASFVDGLVEYLQSEVQQANHFLQGPSWSPDGSTVLVCCELKDRYSVLLFSIREDSVQLVANIPFEGSNERLLGQGWLTDSTFFLSSIDQTYVFSTGHLKDHYVIAGTIIASNKFGRFFDVGNKVVFYTEGLQEELKETPQVQGYIIYDAGSPRIWLAQRIAGKTFETLLLDPINGKSIVIVPSDIPAGNPTILDAEFVSALKSYPFVMRTSPNAHPE